MRERPPKRIVRIVGSTLLGFCLLLCLIVGVTAQGSDGRSNTATRKPFVPAATKRLKIRPSKFAERHIDSAPKLIEPKPGRLSIVVNEGGSRVYLSDSESTSNNSLIAVTSGPQSLVVRILPPSRYTLSIKKTGFFDELRSLDLRAGDRRKLVISLRPQMSLLSLKTNLADADIEIESLGRFTKPLKKFLVKPGKYRINLKRRGYISQTVTADLAVAGKEQSIYVVLQPLRIDAVLTQASELLAKGGLDLAAALVNDVLLLNNSHAKANLLFGMIQLRKGDPSASVFFLKAIKGGETVSMPSKTMYGDDLAAVLIQLDRDAIVFQSRSHTDLNFRITRPNLEDMQRFVDINFLTYIAVKAESDFYGRGIHPQMKIFSSSSEMDPVSKQVNCRGATESRSCAIEIDVLFQVIKGWRDLSSLSLNRR